MKTKLFTFSLLVLCILFAGCKTKEIITTKTVKVVDSTEIVNLKTELSKKNNLISVMQSEVNKTKQENEKLQANTSVSVREFDTDKPNVPLKKETLYVRTETSEKEKKESEKTITELKNKLEISETQNADFSQKVTALIKENTDMKSKKYNDLFSLKSAIFGAIGIIILEIIAFLIYKAYKPKLPL